MVSIAYVNGTCSCVMDILARPYEEFLESCMDDFYTDVAESVSVLDEMQLEFDIFEEKSTQPATVVAKKKNIFERVGQTIISLFEKLADFIDNILTKLKSISFKRKSDTQKLEVLIKKHPELKQEVIAAVDSGLLNMKDFESFRELDRAFDQIMKMNADPKTLEGKWNAAKRKFERSNESWLVQGAKSVTTVITAANAVLMFLPNATKAYDEMGKRSADARKRKAEIAHSLSRLDNKGNADTIEVEVEKKDAKGNVVKDKDGNPVMIKEKRRTGLETEDWKNTGVLSKRLAINREYCGLCASTVRAHGTMIQKTMDSIAGFLDRHLPEKITKGMNDRLEADIKVVDDRKKAKAANAQNKEKGTT